MILQKLRHWSDTITSAGWLIIFSLLFYFQEFVQDYDAGDI